MLNEQIITDLTTSMKQRDELKTSVLRMLKSAVKNKAIEKKVQSLDDSEILSVIQKEIKQRRDSIEEFKKAGRLELVAKEEKEVQILECYLPKQLTDDDLKNLVLSIITQTGAKSKADMGKVIKEVMAKAQGQADGKRISSVVASSLVNT